MSSHIMQRPLVGVPATSLILVVRDKQVLCDNRVRIQENVPDWEDNIRGVGVAVARYLCAGRRLA